MREVERLLKAFHGAQERGDFEEAEAVGVQCLALAAEQAEKNPSESLRLTQEAHAHEDAARWEQAKAAHRRVLVLAQAEGNQAAIFKAKGEIFQAEQDLEVAWRILAPRAKATIFAGFQGSLAVWWEIKARIRTQAKDFAGAARAMAKAVEFRRTVSQLPQLEGPYKHHALAKALQEYSLALSAAGEVEAANAALDESRRIQHEIGIAIPPPGAV